MKAVILCGGLATRMLPISKCVPKEMMPILNRPLLEYLIDDLVLNGIKDVLIVTTRGKESIENYFDCNVEIEQRLEETGKTEMLETLNSVLVSNRTKSRKMHFFVIEYGVEDREGQVSQDTYLRGAMNYLRSLKIFNNDTDAIFILISIAD